MADSEAFQRRSREPLKVVVLGVLEMAMADDLISKYKIDLANLIGNLDPKLRPNKAVLDKIMAKDIEDIKRVAGSLGAGNDLIQKNEFGLGDWIPGIPNPFDPKAACILTHIAIGAAVLAAWVASGGTLAIGASAAGVQITQPIYAALVGGASGAVIAAILCG